MADSDSGLSRLWDQEHDQHVTRKLLEMRYVREMTPRKIAATTGMNSNAVSVMLHRVRRALRDCIERQLAARSSARPS